MPKLKFQSSRVPRMPNYAQYDTSCQINDLRHAILSQPDELWAELLIYLSGTAYTLHVIEVLSQHLAGHLQGRAR